VLSGNVVLKIRGNSVLITHVSNLVTDWGGFEELIAELHSTGDVTVEKNVILQGRSGATRQIDVMVRHRQGLYEHLIIIECKYLKRSVTRAMVDALAHAVQDLGASRGAIFSQQGFQKGAVRQAKHSNIDLFRVRDVSLKYRGTRYVRCLSQISQYSCLSISGISVIDGEEVSNLWSMSHKVRKQDERQRITTTGIEGITDAEMEQAIEASFRELYQRRSDDIDPDYRGVLRFVGEVDHRQQKKVLVSDKSSPPEVDRFRFKIGIKIHQDPFVIDVFWKFAFVLAIEDCVRKKLARFTKRSIL
jgi:Restriction endonuclease